MVTQHVRHGRHMDDTTGDTIDDKMDDTMEDTMGDTMGATNKTSLRLVLEMRPVLAHCRSNSLVRRGRRRCRWCRAVYGTA